MLNFSLSVNLANTCDCLPANIAMLVNLENFTCQLCMQNLGFTAAWYAILLNYRLFTKFLLLSHKRMFCGLFALHIFNL